MKNCNEAIEKMYEYRSKMIVLGLTGMTGSGCTTTAKILAKKRFEDLDLKPPKTYDYLDSEERKQELIYNYMQEGHILSFGKSNNPIMNLFYGAIGNAYILSEVIIIQNKIYYSPNPFQK